MGNESGKCLLVHTDKDRCLYSEHATMVEEFGRLHGLAPRCVYQLSLALDEILTNIAMHGYTDPGRHCIQVFLRREEDSLVVTVEDDARPFNPLEAPLPDVSLPPDQRERAVGGLGILLARRLMDSLCYERRGDRNVLVMKKRIHCQQDGGGPHECLD